MKTEDNEATTAVNTPKLRRPKAMNTEKPPTPDSLSAASGSALGELTIWEEEGGYCSPAISVKTEVGEISIEGLIEQVIHGCPMNGGRTGHRVEITVRLIAPNDRTELRHDERNKT